MIKIFNNHSNSNRNNNNKKNNFNNIKYKNLTGNTNKNPNYNSININNNFENKKTKNNKILRIIGVIILLITYRKNESINNKIKINNINIFLLIKTIILIILLVKKRFNKNNISKKYFSK